MLGRQELRHEDSQKLAEEKFQEVFGAVAAAYERGRKETDRRKVVEAERQRCVLTCFFLLHACSPWTHSAARRREQLQAIELEVYLALVQHDERYTLAVNSVHGPPGAEGQNASRITPRD